MFQEGCGIGFLTLQTHLTHMARLILVAHIAHHTPASACYTESLCAF